MSSGLANLFLVVAADAAAKATPESTPWLTPEKVHLLIAVAVILGSIALGNLLSRWLRMPEYAGKIGFILFTFIAGIVTCLLGHYKFGIDLKGGNVLVYQVQGKDMDGIVKTVADKLNHSPSEQEELEPLSVASRGSTIEIEIPAASNAATVRERVAKMAASELKTGTVREGSTDNKKVLIYEVSENLKHVDMNDLVMSINRRLDPGGVKELTVRPRGTEELEIIVPEVDPHEIELIKKQISTAGLLQFRICAHQRAPEHEKLINRALASDRDRIYDNGVLRAQWVRRKSKDVPVGGEGFVTRVVGGETEVLVVMDTDNVTGDLLDGTSMGRDQYANPCVQFSFNGEGSSKFAHLTRANAPDEATGVKRNLAVLMDSVLQSAPVLQTAIVGGHGEITGRFTEDEVRSYVNILNAGRLHASLNPLPIREESISAQLGQDTVTKGFNAMTYSTLAVLIFMLAYYRFAGMVADLAVVMNMVLAMALMIIIHAALTLPGLAGLVLTVGMAVDANVLIYERMREEAARGASLRMTIRNGFTRAFTTIIDSNLTTVGTAVVLFAIGTSQIKGFAISIILGLGVSLYTAVFVARVIFDISERQGWIKKINFGQIIGETKFDFVKWRTSALVASTIVIAIGLGAFVARERGVGGAPSMWDIDFKGGNSVNAVLTAKTDLGEVRTKLKDKLPDLAVSGVGTSGEEFKIDTSAEKIEDVTKVLVETFGEQLKRYSMSFDSLQKITHAGHGPQPMLSIREMTLASLVMAAPEAEATVSTDEKSAKEPAAAAEKPAETPTEKPATAAAEKKPSVDNSDPLLGGTRAKLHFPEKINFETLKDQIDEQAKALGLDGIIFDLRNPQYTPGAQNPFDEWSLETNQPQDVTSKLLTKVQEKITQRPVFTAASSIGGRVGGQTQYLALYALIASMVIIVLYVWFRFHSVAFGVAAVVALIHDVLVAVGFLALSYYLADLAGFGHLMVDPFKINLTVVAALLTIVGYSVNDTIVIFDRVREIRGKSPELSEKMINDAVNQTLSRTILTSGTVLIGATILYFCGGEGIHAFAYTMLVGLVSGTYSTVYIASPWVLLMRRDEELPKAERQARLQSAGSR
jgi:SecD/SecF fusion protein